MKKGVLIIGFLALAMFFSGCGKTEMNEAGNNTGSEGAEQPAGPGLMVSNPAADYCIEQNGEYAVKTRKIGQYGVCYFDDNRQCEEWALLRGHCPAGGLKVTGYATEAEAYCAITGGTVETVEGTPMCKRVDGTYCNAQANFDGDCPDPNDPEPNAGNSEG